VQPLRRRPERFGLMRHVAWEGFGHLVFCSFLCEFFGAATRCSSAPPRRRQGSLFSLLPLSHEDACSAPGESLFG
jgi:hypothetical protein